MATRYLTLQQERADLMAEWARLENADGGPSAEGLQRIAAIETRVGEINADLTREERRRELERTMPSVAQLGGSGQITGGTDRGVSAPWGGNSQDAGLDRATLAKLNAWAVAHPQAGGALDGITSRLQESIAERRFARAVGER